MYAQPLPSERCRFRPEVESIFSGRCPPASLRFGKTPGSADSAVYSSASDTRNRCLVVTQAAKRSAARG
jgi:hypothetical protein